MAFAASAAFVASRRPSPVRRARALRLIGTLPKTVDASSFVDHLLSLGMKSRVDEQPDGWALWIYNEDHVAAACKELNEFLGNTSDPRYQNAARAAELVRRKERELDRNYRGNFRDASDIWGAPSVRTRPVTTIMIAICVAVFVLQQWPGTRTWIENSLMITSAFVGPDRHWHDHGLDDIWHGEVWRLITPIFMHGNFLHILFNMWGLVTFGTLIELRRRSSRLIGLVLITAVVSNLGQFIWMERGDPEGLHWFLGMSGVLYAMFGYVWMKSLYEPEQGMAVSPNNINIMLLWLVLCMTGLMGPIANAAHVMGLASGAVLGLMRY